MRLQQQLKSEIAKTSFRLGPLISYHLVALSELNKQTKLSTKLDIFMFNCVPCTMYIKYYTLRMCTFFWIVVLCQYIRNVHFSRTILSTKTIVANIYLSQHFFKKTPATRSKIFPCFLIRQMSTSTTHSKWKLNDTRVPI